MRTAKTLISLGECWFCHAAAHLSLEVFAQVLLKPACSATEASEGLYFLDIATKDIILPRQRITKLLIRLHGCAG